MERREMPGPVSSRFAPITQGNANGSDSTLT